MSWRSDEFHHRSAERSGWAAELRAADPEEVDATVPGAVEYAAETSTSGGRDGGGSDQQEAVVDPTTVAGSADAVSEAATRESIAVADGAEEAEEPDESDRRCGFCADPIPQGEALDAAGVPFPASDEFEWAGDAARYHGECVSAGDGRFLPWTASGVLADADVE